MKGMAGFRAILAAGDPVGGGGDWLFLPWRGRPSGGAGFWLAALKNVFCRQQYFRLSISGWSLLRFDAYSGCAVAIIAASRTKQAAA